MSWKKEKVLLYQNIKNLIKKENIYQKIVKAPNIQNITLKKLEKKINSKSKIMPNYILTQEEIEAIHKYLNQF